MNMPRVIFIVSAIFIVLAAAPGTVSAFYRMAVGAVLIALPFASRVRRQDKALPATGVKLALLGGLLFAVDVALWATGITISGATNPTLMANTAPLWVGLGAMLFFGERPRGLFWLGLGIIPYAFIGDGLRTGELAVMLVCLVGGGAALFVWQKVKAGIPQRCAEALAG